jgi:hypothetical protein
MYPISAILTDTTSIANDLTSDVEKKGVVGRVDVDTTPSGSTWDVNYPRKNPKT